MLFFQEKFQIFEAGTEFACLDAVDDGDGQNQQRKGLHMLYVAVDEVNPASFAGYIISLCFNYFCTILCAKSAEDCT